MKGERESRAKKVTLWNNRNVAIFINEYNECGYSLDRVIKNKMTVKS